MGITDINYENINIFTEGPSTVNINRELIIMFMQGGSTVSEMG